MAYKLQLKRGASGSLPTGSAGEPLFTTDTNDLYIGTGAANQRFQKYIASGTSAQFLKGDGSLDSTTYTPTSRTLTINGTSYDLSANRTWSVGTVTTAAATTGGQVSFFNGATVITSVSGLYFDGVDKLGVGNSSPAYNLDITGTFRSTGNLTAASIIKSGGTSSQYLMADGSTSTLTNPVTGTGTTNYLPKWTSGSAIGNSLVYDNGTNIGIGTSSPAYTLDVNGTGRFNSTSSTVLFLESNQSATYLGMKDSSGSLTYLGSDNGAFFIQTPSGSYSTKLTLNDSGNLLLNSTTDNGNRLQVTGNGYFSGNVGIGVSASGYRLSVLAPFTGAIGGAYIEQGEFNQVTIRVKNTNPSASANLIEAANSSGNVFILSSSGNLGLGVTPSAWATYPAMQILRASFWGAADNGYFGANYYWDGSTRRYINSNYANELAQVSGEFRFYTAPSGTAGNAISFTQAMTLDASGNLLVGTTNSGFDSGNGLRLERSGISTIRLVGQSSGAEMSMTSSGYQIDSRVGYIRFLTGANTGSATEKIRITEGGNLLVGTTTDSGERLVVSGSVKVATSAQTTFSLISNETSGRTWSLHTAGTTYGSGAGSFVIRNNGVDALVFNSSSAATFSSSVTANGGVIGNANDNYFGNYPSGDYWDIGNLGATGNVYLEGRGVSVNINSQYRAKGSGSHIWTYNGGSNEVMRTTSAGNLLVGTTTDSGQKLVVAGDTFVNGNLLIGLSAGSTAWMTIQSGGTSKAQINLSTSTAPTSPSNGDIWFDGTNLKMRIGGVTKTFTLV